MSRLIFSPVESWGTAARRLSQTNAGGLLLLIVASWWLYGIVGQGFLSSFNLFTLSQLVSETIVIGLAQLVLIAIGRLNLAVGAIGVCVAMTTGWLMAEAGLEPVVSAALGIAFGGAIGAFAGWLELRTGLQSFIVTLAIQSICIGAVLILSGGASITDLPAGLVALGSAQLFSPYLSVLIVPAAISTALLHWLYGYSSAGWKMLSIGANQKAAELSGVAVPRMIIASFALSGLLSGIAAMMEMARVAAALPSLGGDWLLASFIVPILGGAALAGGSISIAGAILAAVFIESINSGLVSMNVDPYWQQFAQALALLLAVLLDRARRSARWPSAREPAARSSTIGGDVGQA
jgi:ribose transport system permease protein